MFTRFSRAAIMLGLVAILSQFGAEAYAFKGHRKQKGPEYCEDQYCEDPSQSQGSSGGHRCKLTNPSDSGHWKRHISYQNKNDLFYNFYDGPNPSGTATGMYVSPLPVPANVGHTYTTYQPLMPHEYLYHHSRSHYAYARGAGWTRAKVRYCTHGLRLQDILHNLNPCY